MIKIKLILIFVLFVSTIDAFSQGNLGILSDLMAVPSTKNNNDVPTGAPTEYTAAVLLVDQALGKLNSGNVIEGNDLINKSVDLYPTINGKNGQIDHAFSA